MKWTTAGEAMALRRGVGVRRWPAREIVAPAAAIALALLLRLAFLGSRNTWYDEVGSLLFAEQDPSTIVKATAADTMPPLYYFVLHYWLALGSNLWVARSLSVLLSLVAAILTYTIARRLLGSRVALLAGLLFALSPFQVYHGQEVRMYALLLVAQLAATFFFLNCLRSGRRRDWVGLILTQAAALYTHNAAFVHLATLDLYAGLAILGAWRSSMGAEWRAPPSDANRLSLLKVSWRRFLAGLAASHLATLVLFTPWLLLLPGQLAKVSRAFWIARPGAAELVRTVLAFSFGLPAPAPWALPLLLALSLLLLGLAALRLLHVLRGEPLARPSLLFLLTLLIGPLAVSFGVSQIRPIYVERSLIAVSAVYCILVAWTLLGLRPRLVAVAVGLPVGLVLAWSLWFYYGYAQFPRPAFGTLATRLRSEYRIGDVILHDNKLTFLPAHYLDRSLPQGFVADPPWSINDTFAPQTQEALGLRPTTLDQAAAEGRRILFVIFRQAVEQAVSQGRRPENKAWLDDHLRLTGEQGIGDLIIYSYEPAGR